MHKIVTKILLNYISRKFHVKYSKLTILRTCR